MKARINNTKILGRYALPIFWFLLFTQYFALIDHIIFFVENQYLKIPFIYDKSNSFMDYFNTLSWSGVIGRYTDWGSVYPPLTFILLEVVPFIFGLDIRGYGPFQLREDFFYLISILFVLYFIFPIYAVLQEEWGVFSNKQRAVFLLFLMVSSPLLFAVERGNLIIICLFLLPVVVRSRSLSGLICLSLMINLKPYFAILLFAYLFSRDYRAFIQGTLLSGSLFIFSGLALDLNFPVFLTNVLGFAGSDFLFSKREVLALPSSVSAIGYVFFLESLTNPLVGATVSWLGALPPIIELVKIGGIILLLGLMMWAGPLLKQSEIFIVFLAIIINSGISVGGYSQLFYIICIPYLARMRFGWIHLGIVLLIFAPLDLLVIHESQGREMFSYLGNQRLEVDLKLGAGSVLRPALNYLLLLTFSYEILWRIRWEWCPGSSFVEKQMTRVTSRK